MDKETTAGLDAVAGQVERPVRRQWCNTCSHWQDTGMNEGICKRYPPVIDHLQLQFARELGHTDADYAGDSIIWWAQPKTDGEDWCGEHRFAA